MMTLLLSVATATCPAPEPHPEIAQAHQALRRIPGLTFEEAIRDKMVPTQIIPNVECALKVKEALLQGKDFYFEPFFEDSVPLGDFETYEDPGWMDKTLFFHYTKDRNFYEEFIPKEPNRVKAHQTMVKNGTYDAIFKRTKIGRSYGLQSLYVASEPTSSKWFGRYRLALRVDPGVRVLDLGDWKLETYLERLDERFPHLQACHEHWESLVSLIAEASGVGLIQFKPLGSHLKRKWFMLLGHGAITGSDAENTRKTAY